MENSDALREWMKSNDFEVKTLAEHLNINPVTIYKFLSGERAASNGLRLRFAQSFGLDKEAEIFGVEHATT